MEPEKDQENQLKKVCFHSNPFFILGVSTKDNRKKIVEAAEDRSFEYDYDSCQKARSDLTNPRSRLAIEIEWLPGVSPQTSLELIEQLSKKPFSILDEVGLPTLAHLNLLSVAFESIDKSISTIEISGFIFKLSTLVDELNIDDELKNINSDRLLSGFPEIKDFTLVENQLSDRQRYYRNTINNGLNNLPSLKLVEILTYIADKATNDGENHAPELINDIIDSYQMEAHAFLELETKNIEKLISAISSKATSNDATIKPLIDKLVEVTRNWDMVAQPIQLIAKSRGLDHKASIEVASIIRSLGIELFNEHGLLKSAKRITRLLQELFSELPELIKRVNKDSRDLEEML